VVAKLEVLSEDNYALPGFGFSTPYTVTMRYLPGDLEGVGEGGGLSIARYDEGALLWRIAPGRIISAKDFTAEPAEGAEKSTTSSKTAAFSAVNGLVEASFDRPGWLALVAQGVPEEMGEKAGATGGGETRLGATPIPVPQPTGRPAETTGGSGPGLPIMVVVALAGTVMLLWLVSKARREATLRGRQKGAK
jgi:hypothetical protein